MARNESTAMLICVVFTVAVSVVVQQSEPREVGMISPLQAGALPVDAAKALRPVGPLSAGEVGRREAWVRQFARTNTMDMQGDENRATANLLALLPPADPVLGERGPLGLPPLVSDEGIVVADAESAELEFPPEIAEPTVLASPIPVQHEPRVAEPKVCEVAKGDTLSKIVRREWNSSDPRLAALLVEANPKVRERKGVILAGEKLVIPGAEVVQRVLAGTSPKVALAGAGGSGAGVQPGAPATADVQWYTIQRNDTLANIAKRFLNDPQRWREILALNRALDPRKIAPGMRIKLPPVMRLAQG